MTPSVFAATFSVNTPSDTHDNNPGDGHCVDASGKCSLRAAIEESNHPCLSGCDLPGFPPEIITLPSGTYKLTLGELVIMNSLDLNGAGSDSTSIDGNDKSRVISIAGNTKPIVHFSGVTIQNGFGGDMVPGGGIFIDSGAYLALSNSVVTDNKGKEFGGGLSNGGELHIFNSTIQNNCVSNNATPGVPCNSTLLGSGGGQTESGGGILNFDMGNITIDNSTISGNRATRGGGIRNAGGHLEITNSTIRGNTANTRGGGIMNFGTAFIAFSTIAFNEANAIIGSASEDEDSFGGGIYNATDKGAVVLIGNTLLAMNTDHRDSSASNYAPDCYSVSPATFTSFRGNVVGILNANCNLRAVDEAISQNLTMRGLVHVQNRGDQPLVDSHWAGTKGQSLRLEGFGIVFAPTVPGIGLRYMCHLEGIGDTALMPAGSFCGTRGQSRRLEGFAIQLTDPDYDVYYGCHLEGIGDTGPVKDGEFCGTRGESRRVEALVVWVIPTGSSPPQLPP